MKPTTLLIALIVALILTACRPAGGSAPTPAASQTAASTASPPPPTATPTEIGLPFNDQNVDSQYCQSPSIVLSSADAQGLSEDEIAAKLVDLWLAYFAVPAAPDYCRIDGYRIDKVYYDERTPYLPLEPKGDFMRVVQFSIKLIQVPNFWMSWAGEIDPQFWLHTGNHVAVFRSRSGYTMQFAYP